MTTATDLERAMQDYLARGGQVEQLPPAGLETPPVRREHRKRPEPVQRFRGSRGLTRHTERRAETHIGTIRQMLSEGKTLLQILAVIGGGFGQLRDIIQAYGLQHKPRGAMTDHEITEKLVMGLEKGHTLKRVCKEQEINYTRACVIFRKYAENDGETHHVHRGTARVITDTDNVALMVLLYRETHLDCFRDTCSVLGVGEDRANRALLQDSVLRGNRP